MNKYELALVVSAKLEDEARTDVLERAKSLISRFGGEITEIADWGKKRLAYEIQKETEGFYFFIQFTAEPTAPAEIEKRMRLQDKKEVLRYLVVSDAE